MYIVYLYQKINRNTTLTIRFLECNNTSGTFFKEASNAADSAKHHDLCRACFNSARLSISLRICDDRKDYYHFAAAPQRTQKGNHQAMEKAAQAAEGSLCKNQKATGRRSISLHTMLCWPRMASFCFIKKLRRSHTEDGGVGLLTYCYLQSGQCWSASRWRTRVARLHFWQRFAMPFSRRANSSKSSVSSNQGLFPSGFGGSLLVGCLLRYPI